MSFFLTGGGKRDDLRLSSVARALIGKAYRHTSVCLSLVVKPPSGGSIPLLSGDNKNKKQG
jgi:hypothetical protein